MHETNTREGQLERVRQALARCKARWASLDTVVQDSASEDDRLDAGRQWSTLAPIHKSLDRQIEFLDLIPELGLDETGIFARHRELSQIDAAHLRDLLRQARQAREMAIRALENRAGFQVAELLEQIEPLIRALELFLLIFDLYGQLN